MDLGGHDNPSSAPCCPNSCAGRWRMEVPMRAAPGDLLLNDHINVTKTSTCKQNGHFRRRIPNFSEYYAIVSRAHGRSSSLGDVAISTITLFLVKVKSITVQPSSKVPPPTGNASN